MSVLRDYEQLAEQENLRVVEVVRKAKHFFMVLENGDGDQMFQPVGVATPSSRDRANVIAQFRRFSRGQTHGLKVKYAP